MTGTLTGTPVAVPIAPRPTVTTCPCGAAYTGLDGDEWFKQHQKQEHPPSAADTAKTLDEIKTLVQKALAENESNPNSFGNAIHELAEFFGLSV